MAGSSGCEGSDQAKTERIGIAFSDLPAVGEYARLGKLAEDLGYESVWVSEPRMSRDAVTGMAVLASATQSIKIGSSVINNWTRGPGLAAVTFATLNALAPGRIMMGIGPYWNPLAANQGIEMRKPLTALREYIHVVRRLWAGDTVTLNGEVVRVRDLKLDKQDGEESVRGSNAHIPIYIGATRPLALEMVGEIGDGAILNAAFSCAYVRDSVEHVARGAVRHGRRAEDIDLPKLVLVALDGDNDAAWHATKLKITRYLAQQPHVQEASGLDERLLTSIQRTAGPWPSNEAGLRAAAKLVPDATVRHLAVTGSSVACRSQLREIVEAGASYPILCAEHDLERVMREFAPRKPVNSAAPHRAGADDD